MNKEELRPRLSVVTPTYNQGPFLRETIESVLAQDYSPIEYLVIDDGSTDETRDILKEYTGRIRWETQPNCGQTLTINKGWQRCTGEVIAWLNSDDTFVPGAVSKAMQYLENHPDVDIVFGDTLFTEADGKPIVHYRPPGPFNYDAFVVNCRNTIPQPSAFIRRSVVEETGFLDPYYYFFMDWDFWLRAGIRHSIVYTPDLFSTYRVHATSKSISQPKRSAPELEYMYDRYFARKDVPPQIRKNRGLAFANMYLLSATFFLRGNDRMSAAKMGLKALKTAPWFLFSPRRLHQLMYCFFGGSGFYRALRNAYRSFVNSAKTEAS